MRHIAYLGMAMLLGVLAACSSSTPSGSGNGASTGSSAAAAATSTATCTANVQKLVETYSAPISLRLPALPEPISSLKLSGKSVAYVGPTQFQPILDVYQGLSAAGRQLGFKVKLFSSAESAADQNAAVSDAVDAHPSVIVVSAIQLSLISVSLRKAAAAGIPVVSVFEPSETPDPNVKYTVLLSGSLIGQELSSYIMASHGCSVTILSTQYSDGTSSIELVAELKKLVAAMCPSTCHLVFIPLRQEDAGTTTISTGVATAVERDPQISFVVSDGAPDATFILQGLRTVGRLGKVGVGTLGGIPTIQQLVSDPQSGYRATADPLDFTLQGWLAADAVLRTLGGSSGSEQIPMRLVVSGSAAASAPFDADSAYEQEIMSSWQGN